MRPEIDVIPYTSAHRADIRRILLGTGWAEQYVSAAQQGMDAWAQDADNFGVYVALIAGTAAGFIGVEYRAWNQLAQIQSLAVDPAFRRQGAAAALVARAEAFACAKQARGIYVDTPVDNHGGRRFYEAAGYQLGYLMPRYYEDALDGVTYQKFF